ncbi:MAG: SIR2 family protein [Aliiglaciecola sp.]
MKTVYILGAGFSVEAGAPTQARLMPEAIRLFKENSNNYEQKRFLIFKFFLIEQLGYAEDKLDQVELEDIFTPLDRCLTESSQFRGISLDKIMEVREAVFYVVGRTIQLILNETNSSKQYINDFARFLTEKSSTRENNCYRTTDPVSVISTNWDILLDNSIHKSIVQNNHNAVVDYCCYISSRDELDESIKPGLEKLGQGGFNVKLLKLHGSLNWLQCPRCMRLYARFSRKDGVLDYENRESCRHCDKNFSEEENNHLLASNLIMPTFIKDLSNPQYKVIWQNAGIEIAEAEKLVFIGYSLPNADFEMRQLLSRMTRKKAKIEVVDFCSNIEGKENIKKHWSKFFGNRELAFNFGGAKAYIENLSEDNC